MPESSTPHTCGRACGSASCSGCFRRRLTRQSLSPIAARRTTPADALAAFLPLLSPTAITTTFRTVQS